MKNFFLLLAMIYCHGTFAQSPESFMQKVQENYTPEKIYLHYDKSNYIAGETIWFKAYLMEGLLPSAKSTVLCVELINDSGKVLQKKMLSVHGSAAVGEFELPKTLRQGSYTVKAFTRHLMNFGFESFYYHPIEIYNPSSTPQELKEENTTSIYFLPEGGNMIANVKNVVAFKCADKRGFPIPVKGKIVDEAGKEQINFESIYNGMGKFEFTPKQYEKYFAECLINGFESRRIPLPLPSQEGTILNVITENNKTMFKVDATTVTNDNLVPSYILGVEENIVVFKTAFQTTSKIINGEIPIKQLATGILQLTVFNKSNVPLAERLLFVNSEDYLPKASLTHSLKNFSKRGKNAFSFNVEDSVPGSFSVAITEFEEENTKSDNIVSRFLLTNDIKGYVHNPAYYFEMNDVEHRQNLDLVMLTNGWRKYGWNEILSNKFPAMAFKDPNFISPKIRAFNPSTGSPLANEEISVTINTRDKKTNFVLEKTDNAGDIFMKGLYFEDTATFVFQSNKTQNKKINIVLSSPTMANLFAMASTIVPKSYFALPNDKERNNILNRYNFNSINNTYGLLLDEVKVKAKIASEKEKYEKKYVSARMNSITAKEIDFITNPPSSTLNIFDYLQGRVTGLNITGAPDYFINYRNTRTLTGGNIPMNILLDEFQVEASLVATLRVQDVAMVKLFPVGGLNGGAGGTLAIYTKRGDGVVPDLFRHSSAEVEGFSTTKEFFSPNYETNDEIKNDERTTLYWNPYLITSAQSKTVNFSFFNSDRAKKFKVVIEGLLEDGKLLRIEKILE